MRPKGKLKQSEAESITTAKRNNAWRTVTDEVWMKPPNSGIKSIQRESRVDCHEI